MGKKYVVNVEVIEGEEGRTPASFPQPVSTIQSRQPEPPPGSSAQTTGGQSAG